MNNKGTWVAHFFRLCAQKNGIYASNYPVSECMKFACAVNIYASSTAINETFGPSFLRGSQIGGIFCHLHAFMIVSLVEI